MYVYDFFVCWMLKVMKFGGVEFRSVYILELNLSNLIDILNFSSYLFWVGFFFY